MTYQLNTFASFSFIFQFPIYEFQTSQINQITFLVLCSFLSTPLRLYFGGDPPSSKTSARLSSHYRRHLRQLAFLQVYLARQTQLVEMIIKMQSKLVQFSKTITLETRFKSHKLFSRGFLDTDVIVVPPQTQKSSAFYFSLLPADSSLQSRRTLLIGDKIFIQHQDSQCFLTLTQTPSFKLKGFLVGLSPISNQNCVFRILPARSFDKIGDLLTQNSPIKLQNQSSQSFLCYPDNESRQQVYNSQKSMMQDSFESNSFLSSDEKVSGWSVKLQDLKGTIFKSHEIVYLRSTENLQIISPDPNFQYLQVQPANSNSELSTMSCYFQLILHDQSDSQVALRQLLSGRQLSVDGSGQVILQFNQNHFFFEYQIICQENIVIQLKYQDKYLYIQKQFTLSRFPNHALQVNKVTPTVAKNLRMFNSCHAIISRITVSEEQLIKMLKSLNIVLNNQNSNLFRQMTMFELLFPLVDTRVNESGFGKNKILRLTCQILKKTLRDNLQNKRYAAKWIPELLDQATQSFVLAQTISQILRMSDSFPLQITQIKSFTESVFSRKTLSDPLLRVLRDFVCSKNRPVKPFQNCISNFLRPQILKLELTPKPQAFLNWDCAYCIDLSSSQLTKQALLLRQYLYLMADCAQDNEQLKPMIQKQYPLKLLIEMLQQVKDVFAGPLMSLILKSYFQEQSKQYLLTESSKILFRLHSLLAEQVQFDSFKLSAFCFVRMAFRRKIVSVRVLQEQWLWQIKEELTERRQDKLMESKQTLDQIKVLSIIQIKIICLQILSQYCDIKIGHLLETVVDGFVAKAQLNYHSLLQQYVTIPLIAPHWFQALLGLCRYQHVQLINHSISLLKNLVEWKKTVVFRLRHCPLICTQFFQDFKRLVIQSCQELQQAAISRIRLVSIMKYISNADSKDSALLIHSILQTYKLYQHIFKAIQFHPQNYESIDIQLMMFILGNKVQYELQFKLTISSWPACFQYFDNGGCQLLSKAFKDFPQLILDKQLITRFEHNLRNVVSKQTDIFKLLDLFDRIRYFKGQAITHNENLTFDLLLKSGFLLLDFQFINSLLARYRTYLYFDSQGQRTYLLQVGRILKFLADNYQQGNKHCLGICLRILNFSQWVELLKQSQCCWQLRTQLWLFGRKIFYKSISYRNIQKLHLSIVNEALADLKAALLLQERSDEMQTTVQQINLLFSMFQSKKAKSYALEVIENYSQFSWNLIKVCERLFTLGFECQHLFSLIQSFKAEVFKIKSRQRSKSGQDLMRESMVKVDKQKKNQAVKLQILLRLRNVNISQYIGNSQRIYPIVFIQKETPRLTRVRMSTSLIRSTRAQSEREEDLSVSLFRMFNREVSNILSKHQLDFNNSIPIQTEGNNFCQSVQTLSKSSHFHSNLQSQVYAFLLKLIRKQIVLANLTSNQDVDIWPPQFWKQRQIQIQRRQKQLLQAKAPNLVNLILNKDQIELQLANQLFHAGIALLLGGYTATQSRFLSLFEESGTVKVLKKVIIQTLQKLIAGQKYNFGQSYQQRCGEVLGRSFKFLQLLSENNNNCCKLYLLEQSKSIYSKSGSVNFVELSIQIIDKLFSLKDVQSRYSKLLSFIIQFINEVAQVPNTQIQCLISKSSLWKCSPRELSVQRKLLIVLLSLLQSSNEQILDNLKRNINKSFLQVMFNNIMGQSPLKTKQQIQHQIYTEGRLGCFTLITQIIVVLQKLDINSDIRKSPIYAFLKCHVRKVQVVIYKQPKQVFFPYHPIFELLSKDFRKRVVYDVTCSTRKEKLVSFIQLNSQVSDQIQCNFTEQQKAQTAKLHLVSLLKRTAQVISLLINLLIILSYKPMYVQPLAHNQKYLFKILSLAHLLTTLAFISLWSKSRLNLLKIKLKKRKFTFDQFLIKLFSEVKQTKQMCTYVLVSVLACVFWQQLYTCHLLIFMLKFQVLENITNAVLSNSKQLLLVFSFALVWAYIYAMVFFPYYQDQIRALQDLNGNHCGSLFQCFVSLFASGIIGYQNDQPDHFRFLADILYNVLFQTLLSNILAALLIDKFAELRDQRQRIQREIEQTCFVCGVSRVMLDKINENFQQHINSRHNLWDYQFYIYCLLKKHQTDYTGVQYAIRDSLKKSEIDWLPQWKPL